MSQVKAPVAEGGCQCGAVRYAFTAPLENAHACHCRMCQRAVGGAFALLAGGKKEKFAWTKGEPAFYASSNVAKRAYCRDCGTPLTFAYDMPEARIYVTIGSLDDANAASIIIQYGVESRLDWVRFCEGIPSEQTGAASPEAAAFVAKIKSNQGS
jgi:hypothetical protein